MSDAAGTTVTARGLAPVTIGAAVLVVLLALGALLWPRTQAPRGAPTVLVFDSSGEGERAAVVYGALRDHLAANSGRELTLTVAPDMAAYRSELGRNPAFLVVPDGVALAAAPGRYLPLAAARRAAPMNLRPTGVLVYREAAGDEEAPWRTRRDRTACGDSLSLTGSGALRRDGFATWPSGLACGPDPYDHAPVLHALRLGAFDYAVVRQWDAERFFASGLLDPADFGRRELVGPVPDLVVMVSRELPRHVRLRCGEALAGLGRHEDDEVPRDRELRLALGLMRLAGFNLLVEPDFAAVRKNFTGNWLPAAD